jgi:hypothetical protein
MDGDGELKTRLIFQCHHWNDGFSRCMSEATRFVIGYANYQPNFAVCETHWNETWSAHLTQAREVDFEEYLVARVMMS